MRQDWQQQFDGWADRCRSLALFDAFLSVQRLHAPRGVEMRSFAMAIMTFILNKMLESQRCTEQDVEEHLRALVASRSEIDLHDAEIVSLREALLERLRNRGSVIVDQFMDFREGADPYHAVRFHLIETYFPDERQASRQICLRLTPEGLDLLFKTKEMHQELGISIAQLLFRQQISRGIFDGAINTLRELRLEVRQRKERLHDLNRMIYRSVQSVPSETIRQMWAGVAELAQRERQTFDDLSALIASTRTDLELKAKNESDRRNMDKLWHIDQGLSRVILDHSEIIRLAAEVAQNHQEAIDRAIGRSLMVTTNLEEEVLDRVLTGAVPAPGLVHWLLPLLKPRLPRHFTPLRAFEPQWLGRSLDGQPGESLIEMDEERWQQEEASRHQQIEATVSQATAYLRPLVQALHEQESVRLSDMLLRWPQEQRALALGDRQFRYMMLCLHREQAVYYGQIRQVDVAAIVEHSVEIAALRRLLDEQSEWFTGVLGFQSLAPADRSDVIFLPDGGHLPNFCFERITSHAR